MSILQFVSLRKHLSRQDGKRSPPRAPPRLRDHAATSCRSTGWFQSLSKTCPLFTTLSSCRKPSRFGFVSSPASTAGWSRPSARLHVPVRAAERGGSAPRWLPVLGLVGAPGRILRLRTVPTACLVDAGGGEQGAAWLLHCSLADQEAPASSFLSRSGTAGRLKTTRIPDQAHRWHGSEQ
eukprot:SAG22_NODE_413_length_10849_cov_6.078977_3_plen_180_part_00